MTLQPGGFAVAVLAALLMACATGRPPPKLKLMTALPVFPSAPADGGSSPLPSMLECAAESAVLGPPLKRFRMDSFLTYKAPRAGERLYAPTEDAQRKAIAAEMAARARAPVSVSREQRAADLYQAGGEALLLGDRATAEAAYRRALALMPEHHDARVALGGLLLDRRRNDEAASVVATGLASAQESAPLRMLQARLWLSEGQDRQALDMLLENSPPLAVYPEYHALIAALQQKLGRHDSAAAAYRQLVHQRAAEGTWWAGLAISEEALGNEAAAQKAYRQATDSGRLSPALRRYVDQRLEALED